MGYSQSSSAGFAIVILTAALFLTIMLAARFRRFSQERRKTAKSGRKGVKPKRSIASLGYGLGFILSASLVYTYAFFIIRSWLQ
jgi:hypothetical protein